MKKLYKATLISLLIMNFTGCSQNEAYKSYPEFSVWDSKTDIKDTIDEAIIEISDQLVKSTKVRIEDKIAVTSFVNLNKLNETSYFGREISESMFNELHIRGFNLLDIRGTKSIRVNDKGEFFITRKINLLNHKEVPISYILIGTYSKFGKGILVNARIVDNKTGDVISTARTVIDINSCYINDNCGKKLPSKPLDMKFKENSRTIGISSSNYNNKSLNMNSNNIYGDKKIVRERINKNLI